MTATTLDAPLRFLVGAEEAQWQATGDSLERASVTDLVGSGCWRELEIDAPTPREVEAALDDLLGSLGTGWVDVIALGPSPRH
jgi:hypothetical protein